MTGSPSLFSLGRRTVNQKGKKQRVVFKITICPSGCFGLSLYANAYRGKVKKV